MIQYTRSSYFYDNVYISTASKGLKVKFLSFVDPYNNIVCHSALYLLIMFKSCDAKIKTFLKLTCLTWFHYTQDKFENFIYLSKDKNESN